MIELALICGLQLILIGVLVADRRSERQEVRAERADLLLRIQSPEHAVVRDYNQSIPDSPPAITVDDDEDFWLDKEDLAEKMGREEVTGGN